MSCELLRLLCASVAVASSLDIDMPPMEFVHCTMGCLGMRSERCLCVEANAFWYVCPFTACIRLEVFPVCYAVADSLDAHVLSVHPSSRSMGSLGVFSNHCVCCLSDIDVAA